MATYVLIHGASSDSWYWHRVVPMLQERGHDVVAPDLPSDDDAAGLAQYADTVVDAIGDRRDLILVAQSMAGFTAPIVCTRVPTDLLVMVAAMVPLPNESPGEWWDNTGYMAARRENDARLELPPDGDALTIFFHDVPAEVTAEAMARGERRIEQGGILVVAAPGLLEAYAVLTRLPPPHRLSPGDSGALLTANFRNDAVEVTALGADDYDSMLRGAPQRGIAGGAIYDAVILGCALAAEVEVLLTFNQRHFEHLAAGEIDIVVP